MAKVEMYTSNICPYCVKAKSLLKAKGVDVVEHNIQSNPDKMPEMLSRSNGRRTVPQIFIDGKHVGGCDDLHELNSKGELDPLLGL